MQYVHTYMVECVASGFMFVCGCVLCWSQWWIM